MTRSHRTAQLGLLLATTVAIGCRRNEPPTTAAASPAPSAPASQPAEAELDTPGPDLGTATPEDEPDPTPAQPPDDTASAEPSPLSAKAAPSPSDLDAVKGLNRQALLDRWGEPDEKKKNRWIYRLPRDAGCVEMYMVFTVTFTAKKVHHVEMTRERTPDHCEPTF